MNKKTISAIKRARTRKLAGMITKAALLYRRKKFDEMANYLCDEFVALGGIYIKFLQGVMLRSQIMQRWHNPNRLKIFENVESEPLNISEYLHEKMTAEQLSKIAGIQPEPFAAGSFGQVYYAQLTDGTQVVVKVLRPMIRELLNHDLRLLYMFYKNFFVKMYKNVDLNLSHVVSDFKKSTLNETDYIHEAEFANELYQHYKNHDSIVIPKTFLELCTEDIIVQEYVGGLSVASLVKLTEQGVNPKEYVFQTLGTDLDEQLKNLGFEAVMGIFTLPRIMGDPHPGNIRLLPGNKVGMIDFGISSKTPEDKQSFFKLLEGYDKMYKKSIDAGEMFERALQFFVGDLYHALVKVGSFVGAKTLSDVTNVAGDSFEELAGFRNISDNPNSDKDMLAIANKIFNKGNRFGIIVKLENSEILRATQTFTSMVGALGRTKEVTAPTISKVIEAVKMQHPTLTEATKKETSLSDAIEIITSWLERVAIRDPLLFQKLAKKIKNKDDITNLGDINA